MKLNDVNKFITDNTIDDSKTSYRQKFHIMAPVGLINDPNGFCFFKGKYYLFYQTHPFRAYHGTKYWGQLISSDLVNWEYKGIALEPEYWFEEDGCFSGNAYIENDKMYLFYTGNLWEDGVEFEVGKEYQCLAISTDGEIFQKRVEPIIDTPDFYSHTPHYRDPKVWRKGNLYYMIIAGQLRGGKPSIDLYCSLDLINWEKKGVFLNAFEGEHAKAYMWECPGYCYIDNKDVLFICPQGMTYEGDLTKNSHQSGYLLGDIDYEQGVFHPSNDYQLMDNGFEFYAPQVFTDTKGRHLCIAWMGLPDEDDHPTLKDNWLHCLTIPTELVMKENKLYRKPIAELKKLRRKQLVFDNELVDFFNAECFELLMELRYNSDVDLYIRASDDMSFYTKLSYNSKQNTVILDRNKSRANYYGTREVKLQNKVENIKIHLFVDRSSIEVFINDGEYVLTSRIFTKEEDTINRLCPFGFNTLLSNRVWELG